jgi:serine/threonine protein kinase
MQVMNHPNICKAEEIFGTGEQGSVIVMEYLSGHDMTAGILFEKKFKYGTIPQLVLVDMLLQMAEALRYMHEEQFMVHRDLHWGNWMLLENNNVKLIDFGLAIKLGKNGFSKDYWLPDIFAPPEVLKR